MIMDIIAWIIVGGLAGWIASKIAKTDAQMGIGANVVVGIIGAVIGGFIVRLITGSQVDTFDIGGFIVAIVGAVIFLSVLKVVTGHHSKN